MTSRVQIPAMLQFLHFVIYRWCDSLFSCAMYFWTNAWSHLLFAFFELFEGIQVTNFDFHCKWGKSAPHFLETRTIPLQQRRRCCTGLQNCHCNGTAVEEESTVTTYVICMVFDADMSCPHDVHLEHSHASFFRMKSARLLGQLLL